VTRPIICLVTDGRGNISSTLDRIRAAAAAGVDLIQIREPSLRDRALIALTRRACEAAATTGAKIVVNDRLDVALAADAHGVHLRANSFTAARVRSGARAPFLIGRSVHNLGEAIAVDREAACDYLLFGTVFRSSSKPEGHPVAGVEAFREMCGRVTLPVVAIGGVTRATLADIAAAGGAGVAAISLFQDLESIPSTVESVRRTLYPSS